jgi:hypothetical protein
MKKKIILSVALVLLVVMVATVCVACTPSVDSVAKKFENKDYTITTKTEKSLIAVKKGEDGGIIGSIVDSKNIEIIWYDDEESAKKAYDAAVKLFGEKRAKIKGNAVATGDEDSIKLF